MKFRRQLKTVSFTVLSLLGVQLTCALVEVGSTPEMGAFFHLNPPAIAATPRYTPPQNRGMPARTLGGGSRGCDLAAPVAFSLLVPHDHMGLTASSHPTFSWYSSAPSPHPVVFALVEPGVSKPVFTQQLSGQQVGINQVKLPDTVPGLVAGRKYRWTVSQVCNPKRPSENAYALGWIERVQPSSQQSQAIAKATDSDRGQVFAEQGFWYDALEAFAKRNSQSPQKITVSEPLLSLLQQGGLSLPR
jgi:hypothetical protein